MIERQDCIYPDCQIIVHGYGRTCEHSCPFERTQKAMEKQRADGETAQKKEDQMSDVAELRVESP